MDDRMFAPLTDDEVVGSEPQAPAAPEIRPIVPVPDDAPAMDYRMRGRGAPDQSWAYHDADGRLVGFVCRWNFLDEAGRPAKEVRPVTFCDLGSGKRAWRAKGIPALRPLFDLPDILARADAIVLVCEGEKARDAGEILFPDMVATTPAHGAKSPHLTDFTPLAGRTVVLATDFDEPGRKDAKGKPLHPGRDFGDEVFRLATEAGAAEVLHLRPERLAAVVWTGEERGERTGLVPDGWDLADALDDGWTAERIAIALNASTILTPYLDAKGRAKVQAEAAGFEVPDENDEEGRVWPFRMVANGVEKRIERTDKETGITIIEWRWFCSKLEITADTRSSEGEEWGRLLQLRDRDGKVKTFAMPNSMLAGDGVALRERLLSLGLDLAPGTWARNALHEYLTMTRPNAKVRCVPRTGWQRQAYVTFGETFGEEGDGERHIVQTTGAVDHAYRQKGTLARWQENVARLAVGNSRLALAMSAAFAAPLLYPVGAESGGIHFRGASSSGKTTALTVAGSVWGGGGLTGFLRSWRATSNGLEGVASMHCDALLCLDEMGQVEGKEAGATAYMIANGQGKTRAGRGGEVRPIAEWRLLFLSSGEISLADKMAEDGRGRRVAAGQEVRIVDLAADAGKGLGVFETLHGFPSADALARHLKMAASEDYGVASHAFLREITARFDDIAPAVIGIRDSFVAEHCGKDADGQVSRVSSRFGLIAAGGEMATACGILPWAEGEASSAAAKCFGDWLVSRGGVEPAEEREAVATVRRFVELHGTSRFEPIGMLASTDRNGDPIETRTINRVGYRRSGKDSGVEYLILPEAWKSEVCPGLDAGMVAKVLAARGFLSVGSDGRSQTNVRLPGLEGTARAYVVRGAILGGEDNHRG